MELKPVTESILMTKIFHNYRLSIMEKLSRQTNPPTIKYSAMVLSLIHKASPCVSTDLVPRVIGL